VNVSHDNVIKSCYQCKNLSYSRGRGEGLRRTEWGEGGSTVMVLLMRERMSAVERSSSTLLGPSTLI
jgi:hypothetical protein